MAYVSQQLKAQLAPQVKAILKKYGVKGSLSVHHHSTLVLRLQSGAIDFIQNYNEVEAERNRGRPDHLRDRSATTYLSINSYWFREHFTGNALAFITEVHAAMSVGNYDKSDIQSDYFNVGWYVDIEVGQWDKPYVVTVKEEVFG